MHQSSVDPIVVSNLRLALEKSGRSAYAVAIAVDHAPNWLYRVLNGKAGILIPTLREVANELGVSAGSLLDSPNESAAKVSELGDAGALAPADSREFRPVLLTQGTGIAAGAGANAADERVLGSLAFRDDWLRRHGLNTAQCRVIEVIGDSMEPTLQHRAMILVDFQRTVRRRDKIFALRTEDGPVVKRLQRDEDGWQLVSDNKAYKPVPWPQDAVVLGQVMWTGRTL